MVQKSISNPDEQEPKASNYLHEALVVSGRERLRLETEPKLTLAGKGTNVNLFLLCNSMTQEHEKMFYLLSFWLANKISPAKYN